MKTPGHAPMHLFRAAAVVVMFAATSIPAAPPPQVKVVAAQRRNDLTANGSFQRIGMLRQQQRVQRILEKQTQAADSKKK